MAQPDRQTDKSQKSTRWAFTAFEAQWHLFANIPPGIAEWGWQREICPKTNKEHYQGYLRLTQQQRFAWLAKILPGVHLEIPRNWQALLNYCKKADTAIPGSQVHQTNNMFTKYTYADHLGKQLYQCYSAAGLWKHWTEEEAKVQIEQHARLDIRKGHREVMWIISDPAWKSAWKYWRDIMYSYESESTIPTNELIGETDDQPIENVFPNYNGPSQVSQESEQEQEQETHELDEEDGSCGSKTGSSSERRG